MSFKNIFNKSNIYLFLFVLFCVAALFTIKLGDFYISVFVKSLRYLFLLLYYLSLVKKANPLIVSVIVIFGFISLFLSYNVSSIVGLLLICLSRAVLIKLALMNIKGKNINWKLFTVVTLLFIMVGFLVLSLYYKNSPIFYVTILSIILLVFLLSISFLNILSNTKRWNLRFFSAISLFVISDAIFGIQRLTEISKTFLLISSIFYNISYFLIIQSDIERQRFINKTTE